MTHSISIGSPLLYTVFAIVTAIMVSIDMLALKQTGDHKVSFREALIWSLIWVAVALLFNLGLWWYLSTHYVDSHLIDPNAKALEFLTGYVVEKSLSMDNIFIFLLIFSFYQVPAKYQRRVLVYGILAAIFLRVVMVLIGSYLIEQFEWILYLFGGFLLYTGIKMFFEKDEEQPNLNEGLLFRVSQKLFNFTDQFHQERFFIRKEQTLYATPLFLVLIIITFADIVFAVDSVPAVFAVTKDPFIVMTSNVFAILGLRAMYFLLADMADRFHLIKYGLAFILTFIGSKMILLYFEIEFPTLLSLAVILGALIVSILLSLYFTKEPKNRPS